MLLRRCRTVFSSAPISRELIREFSGMRGSKRTLSPQGSSTTSRDDGGQCDQQSEICTPLNPVKRKERPVASIGAAFCYKRRTRIDLGTMAGPIIDRGAKEIVSRQTAVSVSTSESQQEDEFSLPTSFGKKLAPFASGGPGIRRTRPASGVAAQTSSLAEASDTSKPFDICFSDSTKLARLRLPLDDIDKCEQLTMDQSIEENGHILRPGMVLLKNYIQLQEQVEIVKKCQQLGLGQGGFYQPRFKDGAKLRLHMMCLGRDWDPQTKRYGKIRQHDGSEPPDIPPSFRLLVSRALEDSSTLIRRRDFRSDVEAIPPQISPDTCIVNFYTPNGRLGLHQDRDESKESLHRGLPVVSVSIGDFADFLYGDERNVNKAERVLLESGDVLIFGGKARHIFHGVASVVPNTAPPDLIASTNLRPGRLNLTFRQY